jgi:1-acyl-sn-glycerol-3-phosphate acyltransferase
VKLHYRIGRAALLILARVLWRFRSTGGERVPAEGPVLIACNHVSNWDPILVGLGVRREIHFVAKEELFRNLFLRKLIQAYNAMPMRRGVLDRKGLKQATGVLTSGGVLLVFPEGTRSRTGELRKARPGIGFIGGTTGAPVVPAYITGSQNLREAFRRRRGLSVVYGEPMPPARPTTTDGYRELAERIMAEIAKLKREVDAQ